MNSVVFKLNCDDNLYHVVGIFIVDLYNVYRTEFKTILITLLIMRRQNNQFNWERNVFDKITIKTRIHYVAFFVFSWHKINKCLIWNQKTIYIKFHICSCESLQNDIQISYIILHVSNFKNHNNKHFKQYFIAIVRCKSIPVTCRFSNKINVSILNFVE